MDMLVKLYRLPCDAAAAAAVAVSPAGSAASIAVPALRKPIGPEHVAVAEWVAAHFNRGWAREVQVALANRPVSVWIAVDRSRLLGFACYDATARGFFGPIGVLADARKNGLGAALLRTCLHDMRAAGYGYAIVGGAGAPEFFRRVAGATEIADSTPGLYADRLGP